MQAWTRHPDMVAAWAVALALVFAVAMAPWENLRAAYPPGVVDVAQQRFEVKIPGAYERSLEVKRDAELRDMEFDVEGP